mgnify:CR=1 FL=1
MREVKVAKIDTFPNPGKKVFDIDGFEFGVFHIDGEFFAWENRCPHLDGPVCQGILIPCTTEAVNHDLTGRGREFSKTQMNVTCPWHGFEFDIRTGRHPSSRNVRLRSIPLRIENGDVYATVRDR